MKLYLVTRWGSDSPPDYASGPDTHYLVRASSYVEAATLVEPELARMPHEHVGVVANVVIELGADGDPERIPKILLGPMIQFAHGLAEYSAAWVRHYADEDWMPLRE
jgi:hypothetical protein